MAIRSTLAALFADANAEALSSAMRAAADAALADRPSPGADLEARIAALESENAKLKKKLDMAMGAIQASTAQLMSAKRDIATAAQSAKQAMQAATSASATAESAAEGVSELEAKLG